MAWRRITKNEDKKAWKQRYYINTDNGQVITRRQFDRIDKGGLSNEKRVAERRKSPTYFESENYKRAEKARITKARKAKAIELNDRRMLMSKRDNKLIDDYNEDGYEGLTDAQQARFKNLFTAYPRDLVRRWLGSSEESIARRNRGIGKRTMPKSRYEKVRRR